MLDRGKGGLINFLPLKKGGLLEGGGFNVCFSVYFTIIEVKKIIRRFFTSRFHCIRACSYKVFWGKNIFLVLRLQGRSGA